MIFVSAWFVPLNIVLGPLLKYLHPLYWENEVNELIGFLGLTGGLVFSFIVIVKFLDAYEQLKGR